MNDHWHESHPSGQCAGSHTVRTTTQPEIQLPQARDALHTPWDVEAFAKATCKLGLEALTLNAPRCEDYLNRPDPHLMLDTASTQQLLNVANSVTDVALIVSNGLSSTALNTHGIYLLQSLVAAFRAEPQSKQIAGRSAVVARPAFTLGPVCLVPNAGVALSDEIGAILKARLSIIVIGERHDHMPGDWLSIYMTYNPNSTNTDKERSCITNIRPPEGIGYREAAARLVALAGRAMELGVSGTALKDNIPMPYDLNSNPVGLQYPGIQSLYDAQKSTLNR